MKLKFICCDVFFRMACLAAAMSDHTIEFEFTPLKAHSEPENLRRLLQDKIDEVSADEGFDAIILGFGLCGNSTSGLKSEKLKMVIPRVHDCCAFFLGSIDKYVEHFSHRLSACWGAHGYLERDLGYLADTQFGKHMGLDQTYEQFLEKYGEEDAKYLWATLHPEQHSDERIYIKVEPFDSKLSFFEDFKAKVKEEEAEKGVSLTLEPLDGSMEIMTKLVNGDWDEDFLILEPGCEIDPSYDLKKVFYG